MDPLPHVVDPVPVPTEIIRTPAHGPAPANTLVFLRCRGSGADIQIGVEDLVRFEVAFKTKFKIDGYLQQKYDWFRDNTQVSATGMIRLLNTVTDVEFLFALDTIEPFLDLDGVLGFTCRLALQIDGLGFFESRGDIDFAFNVSAYVLVYEPVADLPPSGANRATWRDNPDDYLLQQIRSSVSIRSGGDQSTMALRLRKTSLAGTDDHPTQDDRKYDHDCEQPKKRKY